MPTARALRLCPHAIVVKGRFEAYRAASRIVMNILNDATPLVQPLSIDEAFCDVTGSQRLLGSPIEMARAIRRRVVAETRLTCSVGVATSKFMAKLASDLEKPDGLTVIEPGTETARLDPLDIGRIWGIGPKAQAWLNSRGVRTVAQLRDVPADDLDRRLGKWGQRLRGLINGDDTRPVVTDRQAKQVSHEKTFGQNIEEPDVARSVLLWQAEDVAARLRAKGVAGRSLTLKIRFGDFTTITRSRTFAEPTDVTRDIWQLARATFDEWAAQHWQPLRLLGLGVGNFDTQPQGQLFVDADQERQRRVDQAADAVRTKFGKNALRHGLPRR
jgi:DNA polymerase-4